LTRVSSVAKKSKAFLNMTSEIPTKVEVAIENLEKFAPSYTPENYTSEEHFFLRPFFSNLDRPVFIIKSIVPQEIAGALCSKYSRSTERSLRTTFLKDYILPMAHPNEQANWHDLPRYEKREALRKRSDFLKFVHYLNTSGGIEQKMNIKKGRKFFEKWLAGYGDDSIAEMAGAHLCIEGLSNIATKEVEDIRVGISPLEKSSRYVSFAEKKADGTYQYVVPGEIKGKPDEKAVYVSYLDSLFKLYEDLHEPYLNYIKALYPKGQDESDESFNKSREAKRFDDIRDLLPFATQTNVALYGNARAYETIVNRLLVSPLGELRYWGNEIYKELNEENPSLYKRITDVKGMGVRNYKRCVATIGENMADEMFLMRKDNKNNVGEFSVDLLSATPTADAEILSSFIFEHSRGVPLREIRRRVLDEGIKWRSDALKEILDKRKLNDPEAGRAQVRFRKVPRAFERAHYTFSIVARGGDYRDLHRHRQLSQKRQRFSTDWGFGLDKDVLDSPYAAKIQDIFKQAEFVYRHLAIKSPEVAQYVVPFAYLQHWYMDLTAREIYWLVELRTGPQARLHYKKVCLKIADLAMKASPVVFQGLMADRNEYPIARRESEKFTAMTLKKLEERKS
jgi:thymidylate synthase ThyX